MVHVFSRCFCEAGLGPERLPGALEQLELRATLKGPVVMSLLRLPGDLNPQPGNEHRSPHLLRRTLPPNNIDQSVKTYLIGIGNSIVV